jgi:2-(3-amino-3-carboxypropyl)histidine synthase
MYDFEEEKVRDFLKSTGAKKAAIQLPSGLAKYLPEIESTFRSAGVEALVLADSCYGACDLADMTARRLGCDVLVHYGHSDMGLPSSLPALFVEARVREIPLDSLNKSLSTLAFRRAGLITTVQYIGHLERAKELLLSHGIEPVIGEKGPRAKYPGQILGCDMSCAKSVAPRVDGFIYIGTGDFHPLGVALATGKQVAVFNPVSGRSKILDWDNRKFMDKRKAIVAKAALAERFGVLVSTKAGQNRFKLGKEMAEILNRKGRRAYLLAVDELTPERVGNFGLDAFVSVACPRIALDDVERFEKPILTPFEAMAMLGEVPFEPYQIDQIRGKDVCQLG